MTEDWKKIKRDAISLIKEKRLNRLLPIVILFWVGMGILVML